MHEVKDPLCDLQRRNEQGNLYASFTQVRFAGDIVMQ